MVQLTSRAEYWRCSLSGAVQQTVDAYFVFSSDINSAARDRGRGELYSGGGSVAGRILGAGVQKRGDVVGVMCPENRGAKRTIGVRLQVPNNSIRDAVRRNA